MRRVVSLGWLLAFVLTQGGCVDEGPLDSDKSDPFSAPPASEDPRPPTAVATPDPLEPVLRQALSWAVGLRVTPRRIRDELGMKGVKHFVEYLDLLYHIHRHAPDAPLAVEARARAHEALGAVGQADYHQLATVDERRFRQDSMSYLRACRLAEVFGWDTERYRREIAGVLPRIVAHLPSRGVDQRMGFALLFEQLGLPVVEPLAAIYPGSLIARRVPLEYYWVSADRPYDITHEVFAMTKRGTRAFPFSDAADGNYARQTVRALLEESLRRGQIDIAAELLTNLAYLGETSTPLARVARDRILRTQNPDGSFGQYDETAARRLKGNPLYDVRIGGNLHTTMVVVWALVECAR